MIKESDDSIGAFPQLKRALLPEAIADSVAEAIATRHLKPGERVVETTLAARYAVSRVPIREALKILQTQGVLVGRSHRGYSVASFGPEKVSQVFEVRLILETLLLRDALENYRAGHSDRDPLDVAIGQMRMAARAGDRRAILAADVRFHRAISDAACNEVTGLLWSAIARHVLIIFNLAQLEDIDLTVLVRRHEALRDFIDAEVERPDPQVDLQAVLEAHFMPWRKGMETAAE
ncbi:GntR family transcriptional regulator [Acuticoccus mangrovi]|uniref:GntR family transcriptional regulator n=1 Tax=Acuticoccus mangrovi TaxID=2796142 RepID=A0A934IP62_9HYPH|nr:GntR family transcriptional regulator [Acuticoccus mangrovi]MBJ3776180.1 GntR family transcriptional regulator [Acuticoccus mangrovi]